MNKMIIGKVRLENGEVFEREFENPHDAVKSNYILWRDTRKEYGFYYKGNKIERIGGGFANEIEYLENMIKVIDNCKMFE